MGQPPDPPTHKAWPGNSVEIGPGPAVAGRSSVAPGGDELQGQWPPPVEAVDAARLRELREVEADGLPGLVAELFDSLFRQSAADLATLTSAVEIGNAAIVSLASHRLRGAAATLGAERLAEVCAALESAAGSGELAACSSLLERLRSELAGVASTVEAWSRGSNALGPKPRLPSRGRADGMPPRYN